MLLDRIFLWIPNAETPGLSAVCVALLRGVVLTSALITATVFFLALALVAFHARNFSPLSNGLTQSKAEQVLDLAVVFGCVAVAGELGRYSFVRHAREPLRAACLFTAIGIAGVVLFEYRNPVLCACLAACQVLASVVIVYALRQKRLLPLVITALVIGQSTVLAATMVYVGKPPVRGTADIHKSISEMAAENPQLPEYLFPGADVSDYQTSKNLGVTTWQVVYKVNASPQQADEFYRHVAAVEGLNDAHTLLGRHFFQQTGTLNRLAYSLIPAEGGLKVRMEIQTSR